MKPPKGALLNRGDPRARGLVGYWLLNEGAGNHINDLSGYGTVFNDWTGAVAWGASGLRFTSNVLVTANTTSIPALGSGEYTVVIRLRPTALTNNTGLLSFGSFDPAWAFNLSGNIYIYDGGAKTASTGAIAAGVSFTVAFVRAGTGADQTTYYINGQAAGTCQHADSIAKPATVQLGADRDGTAGTELQGVIEWACVYARALTPREIRDLYADPFALFRRTRIELWTGAMAGGEPAAGGLLVHPGMGGGVRDLCGGMAA